MNDNERLAISLYITCLVTFLHQAMDLIYELYRKLAHTKTLFCDFYLEPDNSIKNINNLSEKEE